MNDDNLEAIAQALMSVPPLHLVDVIRCFNCGTPIQRTQSKSGVFNKKIEACPYNCFTLTWEWQDRR